NNPLPYPAPFVLYQSRAIVLRTVRYGETSLIADLYTEQKGHQTFVINSVRKAKAVTPASFLQLMSLVEVVAYHQEQRPVNRIKELRLEYTYQSLPFDRLKSAVTLCLAEICAKSIRTADPHPALFTFLRDRLIEYDRDPATDNLFLIRFLVGLTPFLGFGLDLDHPAGDHACFDLLEGCLVDTRPPQSYVMEAVDYNALRQVMTGDARMPPYAVRQRLIDLLVLHYQLHVESLREVHSIRVLRDLYAP